MYSESRSWRLTFALTRTVGARSAIARVAVKRVVRHAVLGVVSLPKAPLFTPELYVFPTRLGLEHIPGAFTVLHVAPVIKLGSFPAASSGIKCRNMHSARKRSSDGTLRYSVNTSGSIASVSVHATM